MTISHYWPKSWKGKHRLWTDVSVWSRTMTWKLRFYAKFSWSRTLILLKLVFLFTYFLFFLTKIMRRKNEFHNAIPLWFICALLLISINILSNQSKWWIVIDSHSFSNNLKIIKSFSYNLFQGTRYIYNQILKKLRK